MPPVRPNLFSYATSELSQDAFLCWLLAWADPAHRGRDGDLHAVARAFLDALFDAAGAPRPAAESGIRVHRQLKAADVVVEVGHQHVLVIEDKTHTVNHSDQLVRYRKALGTHYDGRELVCVYLKTGDQSCYRDVKSKGWAVYTRSELLDVLRQGREVTHGVFVDFLEHLERAEAAVNRYLTVAPAAWGPRDPAYKGLYRALQEAGIAGEWDLVNNRAGGFYGFWWGWNHVDDGKLYLQLEEHELVVKVDSDGAASPRELRDRWCRRAVEGLPRFRRPHRLGSGRWMSVAVHRGDYRVLGHDGLLDVNATADVLRRAAEAVTGIARQGGVAPKE